MGLLRITQSVKIREAMSINLYHVVSVLFQNFVSDSMWGCSEVSPKLFGKWVTDFNPNLSVILFLYIFKDKVNLIKWDWYLSFHLNSKSLIDESHESFLAIRLINRSLVYFPLELRYQCLFIKLSKFRELS